MNRIYLTANNPKVYSNLEEILHDWNNQVQFRVYQGYLCNINDVLKMKMSGFTHICFIWQDPDLQLQHHDLELK